MNANDRSAPALAHQDSTSPAAAPAGLAAIAELAEVVPMSAAELEALRAVDVSCVDHAVYWLLERRGLLWDVPQPRSIFRQLAQLGAMTPEEVQTMHRIAPREAQPRSVPLRPEDDDGLNYEGALRLLRFHRHGGRPDETSSASAPRRMYLRDLQVWGDDALRSSDLIETYGLESGGVPIDEAEARDLAAEDPYRVRLGLPWLWVYDGDPTTVWWERDGERRSITYDAEGSKVYCDRCQPVDALCETIAGLCFLLPAPRAPSLSLEPLAELAQVVPMADAELEALQAIDHAEGGLSLDDAVFWLRTRRGLSTPPVPAGAPEGPDHDTIREMAEIITPLRAEELESMHRIVERYPEEDPLSCKGVVRMLRCYRDAKPLDAPEPEPEPGLATPTTPAGLDAHAEAL